MPIYKIKDKISGKTLKITGERPPTEQELTQMFAKARGEQSQQQVPQQQVPQQAQSFDDRMRGVARGAVNMGARPFLETAGTLGGAIAASPGNVLAPGLASVAGGGLGYALGRQGADLLEQYAGMQQPKGVGQELIETGTDIATGAAMEAGGGVIGKPIGAALKYAGKAAPKLYESALKGIPKTIKPFQKKAAIRTALDEGIAPTQKGVLKLNDMIEETNQKISKTIDDAFDDNVLYRGDVENVIKFDKNKISNDDIQGFYFSPDKNFASMFTKQFSKVTEEEYLRIFGKEVFENAKVNPYKLNLKNTLDLTKPTPELNQLIAKIQKKLTGKVSKHTIDPKNSDLSYTTIKNIKDSSGFTDELQYSKALDKIIEKGNKLNLSDEEFDIFFNKEKASLIRNRSIEQWKKITDFIKKEGYDSVKQPEVIHRHNMGLGKEELAKGVKGNYSIVVLEPNAIKKMAINTDEVLKRLDDVKAWADESFSDPTEALKIIDEKIASIKLKRGKTITLQKAQSLKKGIYRTLKDNSFGELKSVEKENEKAFARGLKEELVNQFPQLQQLNAKDSDLINLKKLINKTANNVRSAVMSVPELAAGGIGGGVAGRGAVAPAMILSRLLRIPAVKANLAFALNKAGKKAGVPIAQRVLGYPIGKAAAPSTDQVKQGIGGVMGSMSTPAQASGNIPQGVTSPLNQQRPKESRLVPSGKMSLSLYRDAQQAYISGDYDTALTLYKQLTLEDPKRAVFYKKAIDQINAEKEGIKNYSMNRGTIQ